MSLHISKTRLFAGLAFLGGLMAAAGADAQQARIRSDCETKCTQALFKESCLNMCGDPSQTAAAKKKRRIIIVKIPPPEKPVASVFTPPWSYGEGGGNSGGGGGGGNGGGRPN
jgi:hypothetical protein